MYHYENSAGKPKQILQFFFMQFLQFVKNVFALLLFKMLINFVRPVRVTVFGNETMGSNRKINSIQIPSVILYVLT